MAAHISPQFVFQTMWGWGKKCQNEYKRTGKLPWLCCWQDSAACAAWIRLLFQPSIHIINISKLSNHMNIMILHSSQSISNAVYMASFVAPYYFPVALASLRQVGAPPGVGKRLKRNREEWPGTWSLIIFWLMILVYKMIGTLIFVWIFSPPNEDGQMEIFPQKDRKSLRKIHRIHPEALPEGWWSSVTWFGLFKGWSY